MKDKLQQSRVKVFCPKCEEVYIPTTKSNLDGAFFGSSLVHMFLAAHPKAVELPPCVFFFEPELHGFKIAGKRGSKFFQPSSGPITDMT